MHLEMQLTDGAASAEPNLFELCRVVTEEDGSQISNMSHDPHSCVPLVASGKAERVRFVSRLRLFA